MVKFVHTADWQLGMTRHFLRGEAQARFTAARIDAVGTIGELAAKEGCAFVVVCGDVFESNQVDRKVLLRTLEKMHATPNVNFYLLPGNHDPLDASSIFESRTFVDNKPDNVKVLPEGGVSRYRSRPEWSWSPRHGRASVRSPIWWTEPAKNSARATRFALSSATAQSPPTERLPATARAMPHHRTLTIQL